jgi:hypothetical protein
MWIFGIILSMVVMTGVASPATLPAPPELRMTPPAADLPAELTAFFGTWEGTWDGVLPSRLVVEEIDATSARVVYAWADDPQERFKGGWSRMRAKVLPEGTLKWGADVKFTFKMAKDRRSIQGEREQAEHVSLVTMQKNERE